MSTTATAVRVTRFSIGELFDQIQFGTSGSYLIPMYQRGYTWGKREIGQLLNDFFHAFTEWENRKNNQDGNGPLPYYLGTLVVMQRTYENIPSWEVVDGQQRLTTLVLLYKCLGLLDSVKESFLHFENRPLARTFLDKFFSAHAVTNMQCAEWGADESFELFADAISLLTKDSVNRAFKEYKLEDLEQEAFASGGQANFVNDNHTIEINFDNFGRFLREGVMLFRIELPENIDVSAYFEIMNTRGKQLADYEILKAKLMEHSSDHEDFNLRWNWCADFTKPRITLEAESVEVLEDEVLVALDNNEEIAERFVGWRKAVNVRRKREKAKEKEKEEKGERLVREMYEADTNPRFKFQDFLLIVLSIYMASQLSLNRFKLLDTFDEVIKKETNFSAEEYLVWMEVVRDYLDSHLVRSTKNSQGQLEWTVPIAWTSSSNQPKSVKRKFLKLQSMLMIAKGSSWGWLRDFILSQKESLGKDGGWKNCREKAWESVHAYYSALQGVLSDPKKKTPVGDILAEEQINYEEKCKSYLENLAQKDDEEAGNTLSKLKNVLRDDIEKVLEAFNYRCAGTATPHILLHLLDYLFWENGDAKDCVFRDRDSVEHFYPQNPANGVEWRREDLDSIGNLYLVTTSENSRQSNYLPKIKVEMWEKEQKRSKMPKQAVMYATAKGPGWTPEACRQHAQECERLLREFLNEPPDNGSKNPNGAPEVASRQDVQKSEFDNEQESRPECQEPVETSSQVSQGDVDDGIKRWWEKVEQALHGKLGELKDAEGHRWRELYLEHVEDYDHGHKDKGLIIRFCINRQVYIGTASINSETWNKMKEKYEPRAYIPLDEDCREWQDDELDELVEVLKRPTVEEILRGLRKSPESGGVPGQE